MALPVPNVPVPVLHVRNIYILFLFLQKNTETFFKFLIGHRPIKSFLTQVIFGTLRGVALKSRLSSIVPFDLPNNNKFKLLIYLISQRQAQ